MKDKAKIRKHFADKLTKLIQQYPEVDTIVFTRKDKINVDELNHFSRLRNDFKLNFYTRNDSQ
jgi:hypothetical protein